jgi:hypothetical protein
MAAFPAFLDTCSLFGSYLCDTMLRLAEAGAYRPLWSAGVLDELQRNLVKRGIGEEAVTHRIGQMRPVSLLLRFRRRQRATYPRR